MITAYISGARISENRLHGQCWGDKAQRFSDGEYITSSAILHHDKMLDIITTKNSEYRVVSWQEEIPPFTRSEIIALKILIANMQVTK